MFKDMFRELIKILRLTDSGKQNVEICYIAAIYRQCVWHNRMTSLFWNLLCILSSSYTNMLTNRQMAK